MYHRRQKPSWHSNNVQQPPSSPPIGRISYADPETKENRQASPLPTPKRNRFKTMFFAPKIRDSGISLSAAVDDPRHHLKAQTPTKIPPWFDDSSDDDGEGYLQDELNYLVNELASQYHGSRGPSTVYSKSDRADSPTLGSDPGSYVSLPACRPPSTTPSLGQYSSGVSSGRSSPLPGASLPNSPLQNGIKLDRKARPHSLVRARPRSYIAPQLGLPSVFRSLALTDPNVLGQPIRYLSTAFRAGSNALKVGACTFLNLAYGADVECGLRVEACKTVILQIAQRVVDIDTGRSVWLLCSETNVTDAFTSNVRHELAAQVAGPELLAPRTYKPGGGEDKDDIWLALAHTLSGAPSPVPMRMPAFPTSPPPPSPALADLLSLLTELRFMHRHFFIVRGNSGSRSHFNMRWISSSLHASLSDKRMLEAFKMAAVNQTAKWVSRAIAAEADMFVERMVLPPVPGFAKREEEMGIVGVWMSEDAGGIVGKGKADAQAGLVRNGCWVCFVVAPGVEEVV